MDQTIRRKYEVTQVERPLLAVLADDLTGAADTGITFARLGIPAAVYLRPHQIPATPVVVTVAETRAGPAHRSAALAAHAMEWLVGLEPTMFFKKIDSFLRGFPAAEVEACRTVLQGRLTVIVPSYPALGRLTVGGIHLHELRPIELTEAGRDPVAPARTSSVPDLFGSLHVDLRTVARGPKAVSEAVAAGAGLGRDKFSFDATTDQDLDAIIAGVGDRAVLWVGSAGLAARLAITLAGEESREPLALAPRSGPVLVVAGSASRVTQAQLQVLEAGLGTSCAHIGLVLGHAGEAGAAAALVLQSGRSVLLAPAVLPGEHPDPAGAQAMAEALAEAAVGALTQHPRVGGLVLTGGDTALAVCRRLGAGALEQVCEPAPAIPMSRIREGLCDGLLVVTKGGAVGRPADLLTCVRLLLGE